MKLTHRRKERDSAEVFPSVVLIFALLCTDVSLLSVPLHRSVQSLPDKTKQEALRVDLVDAIRRKQNT